MSASTAKANSQKPTDNREWLVLDGTDQVLGRMATKIATVLMGKHKPTYVPNVDTGDFVIVINASKVALSGSKATDKLDNRHSGYPGGLSSRSYGDLRENDPRRMVEKAVKGMLPHNTLGRAQLSKLKVYAGPDHPHAAQQPEPYELNQVAQ